MKTLSPTTGRLAILVSITMIIIASLTLAMPIAAFAKSKLANDQRFVGKVTAVSSTSITIENKKANLNETLTVSPTTVVKVDKVSATIADVTVGMHAAVMTGDGKSADAIHAHAAKAHSKKAV